MPELRRSARTSKTPAATYVYNTRRRGKQAQTPGDDSEPSVARTPPAPRTEPVQRRQVQCKICTVLVASSNACAAACEQPLTPRFPHHGQKVHYGFTFHDWDNAPRTPVLRTPLRSLRPTARDPEYSVYSTDDDAVTRDSTDTYALEADGASPGDSVHRKFTMGDYTLSPPAHDSAVEPTTPASSIKRKRRRKVAQRLCPARCRNPCVTYELP